MIMEKYITQNGIKYELRGEQYYPTLEIFKHTNHEIGKYGHLHLDFIKKHRRGTYTTLLTEGCLNEHLHNIDELIPNKSNEEILVSKNKTIDQQKKVIVGFAAGCAIGLFILGFIFIEPLRESLVQLGLGIICVMLGIFNMCGNIGTIHWYNRRKVTKENQKAYCMFVGLGTLIVGVAIIAGAVIQALGNIAASGLVIGVGVLIGLALILYAQFKYNKGLF